MVSLGSLGGPPCRAERKRRLASLGHVRIFKRGRPNSQPELVSSFAALRVNICI